MATPISLRMKRTSRRKEKYGKGDTLGGGRQRGEPKNNISADLSVLNGVLRHWVEGQDFRRGGRRL